jgi:hypothetical protein
VSPPPPPVFTLEGLLKADFVDAIALTKEEAALEAADKADEFSFLWKEEEAAADCWILVAAVAEEK